MSNIARSRQLPHTRQRHGGRRTRPQTLPRQTEPARARASALAVLRRARTLQRLPQTLRGNA
eukprot:11783177-Alexandrium_andersonii.AAC.1